MNYYLAKKYAPLYCTFHFKPLFGFDVVAVVKSMMELQPILLTCRFRKKNASNEMLFVHAFNIQHVQVCARVMKMFDSSSASTNCFRDVPTQCI